MNYYVLLGVPQDADADTIRSAFRALARRYHPDAGEGSSPERFRQILSAYETLNDANRRRLYDRTLPTGRASRVQVVESLRAQPAPEPMFSPRPRVVFMEPLYEPLSPRRFDELIDELCQVWDDVFFGYCRGRDRF